MQESKPFIVDGSLSNVDWSVPLQGSRALPFGVEFDPFFCEPCLLGLPLKRRLVSAPQGVASPAFWGGIGSVLWVAAEESVRCVWSLERCEVSLSNVDWSVPLQGSPDHSLREYFGRWNWSRFRVRLRSRCWVPLQGSRALLFGVELDPFVWTRARSRSGVS